MGDHARGNAAPPCAATLARREALRDAHERGAASGPAFVLQRAGVLLQRARTSLWIHGATPAQFDAALPLIREMMRARPHVRLVLTSATPATVAYLRSAFPDDHACAAPWNAAVPVRRFLARLNPRLVVLLEDGDTLGSRARAAVVARDVPLVTLEVARHAAGVVDTPPHVSRALRASGARGRRVVLDGASPAAVRRALDGLRDLLPDSAPLPRVAQAWRVAGFRDRVGQSRLWTKASTLLSRRRVDDWAALRARLGAPRSVLVLGNGPSSEDPRLGAVEHDCLIRVNWRWRARGLLTEPDVVFVGDAATMTRVSSCIFGFWNVALERGMLLRRLATRGPAPIEFVTMERVSPIIRDRAWPARPTNGALAVLLATALQPERLTIAGIDLFRHPDGRYPGDALARNDYSHVHAMSTDLAIIRLGLQDYRGELVVLSEILRRALEDLDRDVPRMSEVG